MLTGGVLSSVIQPVTCLVLAASAVVGDHTRCKGLRTSETIFC